MVTKMSDLVSVIVPVYNVECYLNACVESIINQTYKNIEIWLVDDGATDACPMLCDRWKEKDARINVIHQNNQGLSAARNIALDVCTGEWITFVDSDDNIAEDYIEVLLNLVKKYDVSIAQCNHCAKTSYVRKDIKYKQGVMSSVDFLLSNQYYTMAWGKLYRREIFENLRYPYGKIHEDMAITYKAVYEAKQIVYTEYPLYIFNIRVDSINAKNRYYLEKLAILQFLKEQVDFFELKKESELANKAYRDYAYELLSHYNKVKILLKNVKVSKEIKREYRRCFHKIRTVRGISGMTRLGLYACYFVPELWRCIDPVEIDKYHV